MLTGSPRRGRGTSTRGSGCGARSRPGSKPTCPTRSPPSIWSKVLACSPGSKDPSRVAPVARSPPPSSITTTGPSCGSDRREVHMTDDRSPRPSSASGTRHSPASPAVRCSTSRDCVCRCPRRRRPVQHRRRRHRQLHGDARLGEVSGGGDHARGAGVALVGRPRPRRPGAVPSRGSGRVGDRGRARRRGGAVPGHERSIGPSRRDDDLRRPGRVLALPDRVRRLSHVLRDVGATVPRGNRPRVGRSRRGRGRAARATPSTTNARCAVAR